ncbi:hypothetical protein RJ639_004045 [Escallonia herrerae]|uniref:Retrotransposon gag domain-containing protein n=1 Tax=Escallonia herrerae TaxID=1293975 RepID=A0AA88WBF3_9ASTE|nr:hypothetical protein RJ639_004045 [Escallonia herrerae]
MVLVNLIAGGGGVPLNQNHGQNDDGASTIDVEKFKKLVPAFEGEPDTVKAEAWVNQNEKMFDLRKSSNKQKVAYVIFMLEDEADHWVEMDQEEEEFLKLEQGDMTVVQYEAKLTSLSRYAPHLVDTENHKARRFEKGLKHGIKNRLLALRLSSYLRWLNRPKF